MNREQENRPDMAEQKMGQPNPEDPKAKFAQMVEKGKQDASTEDERAEALSRGQISHEDAEAAHGKALEEADAAVKEREGSIASYQEGLGKAKEKLNAVKKEIQDIGTKISETQGSPDQRQKTYNELNQHREILQRVDQANAEEEVSAYEKNIKDAEAELIKAKERREMFKSS